MENWPSSRIIISAMGLSKTNSLILVFRGSDIFYSVDHIAWLIHVNLCTKLQSYLCTCSIQGVAVFIQRCGYLTGDAGYRASGLIHYFQRFINTHRLLLWVHVWQCNPFYDSFMLHKQHNILRRLCLMLSCYGECTSTEHNVSNWRVLQCIGVNMCLQIKFIDVKIINFQCDTKAVIWYYNSAIVKVMSQSFQIQFRSEFYDAAFSLIRTSMLWSDNFSYLFYIVWFFAN